MAIVTSYYTGTASSQIIGPRYTPSSAAIVVVSDPPPANRIRQYGNETVRTCLDGSRWISIGGGPWRMLPEWHRPTAALVRYTDDRRWEEWRRVAMAELDELFPGDVEP